MFKKFASLLHRFSKSTHGNFALTGALLGVPVMVTAMGLAVDYSQALNARGKMQSALDAAVWSVANLDPDLADADRQAALQKYYASNGGLGAARVEAMIPGETYVTLKAVASHDAPTALMRIVGKASVDVSTRSELQLPYKLTSATLTITRQSGWYAKTFYVYGRKENTTSYQLLAKMVYGGLKSSASQSIFNPNKKFVYSASGAETEVKSDSVKINLAGIDSVYIKNTNDTSNNVLF
ncbi:pilus assembly protein [Salmonella enterica subsp. enterica]|nr:pilus assembly protein [Salmonella enterica subsp. enterica serovar Enteritidis]